MKLIILILFITLINNVVKSKETLVPKNNKIIFDIIRKNKNIGYHSINFSKINDILEVNIEVNINVKIGFLSVYKYKHQNTERWEKNELYSISTNSLTNSKKKYLVEGVKKNDIFEFNGVDGKKTTSKDIIPISYWNKEIINKKEFLDSQKGIIREFYVKLIGNEEILFNSKKIKVEKYEMKVTTKHKSDKKPFPILYIWYTKNGELMKLEFDSPEDNSSIKYVRVE